jgi:hypothetical protein
MIMRGGNYTKGQCRLKLVPYKRKPPLCYINGTPYGFPSTWHLRGTSKTATNDASAQGKTTASDAHSQAPSERPAQYSKLSTTGLSVSIDKK